METLQQGPMLEETMLSAGLDYYKSTMSQLQFEKHPDKEVTFTFMNRGDQRIADYVTVDELQTQLDFLKQRGWAEGELDYLGSLRRGDGEPVFCNDYLNYLANNQLPDVRVCMADDNDITIEATGKWPLVTLWETIVMSQVSEIYFANYVRRHNLDIQQLYNEGDERFDAWVAYLQANPDVKVSEFGTRRRFSLRWQKHITERLQSECPDNLSGTSNVSIANAMGLRPIGTFAHEMPMVYAGIADAEGQDIRRSHNQMLQDWEAKYPDLLVALSDTFTSDFFFTDFTPSQAETWKGLRHDSGDPLAFAARAIAFYGHSGIKSKTKTITFSDALTVQTVANIHETVKHQINAVYGVGTNFTNNLGVKPLNVVMKATHVRLPDGREADTVKLSDNMGKHTGPEALVQRYGSTIFTIAQKGVEHERVLAVV
jgi:nicotinate phosphoribosyltransferase